MYNFIVFDIAVLQFLIKFFLQIMSVDRYVAVCHTLSNALQNMRKPAVSYIVTIVIWAIAILIAIPIMLYSDVIGTRPNCKCR